MGREPDNTVLELLQGIQSASDVARDDIRDLRNLVASSASGVCQEILSSASGVCQEILRSRDIQSLAIDEKLKPLHHAIAKMNVDGVLSALRQVGEALHQTYDTHAAILRQLGYMTGVMPAVGTSETSGIVEERLARQEGISQHVAVT